MSTKPITDTDAKNFDDVLKAELDEIEKSRGKRWRQGCAMPKTDNFRRRAAFFDLVGLAFSGGGIRSATFNLGVLQGLARFKLLRRVDYLSTVSGGGYIGSWFTTWIKRQGLTHVEESLGSAGDSRSEPEADAVSHLRRFSNYLTPKLGIFNADALTAGAIYIRNLLLNFTILIPALMAILVAPRLGKWLTNFAWPEDAFSSAYGFGLGLIAMLSYAVAIGFGLLNLSKRSWSMAASGQYGDEPLWYTRQIAIQLVIVIPAMIGAWAAAPFVLATVDLWLSHVLDATNLRRLAAWTASDRAVWGMPVTLGLSALFVTACVGWFGRGLRNERREWFSRLGAWLTLYAVGWTALCAISIYAGEYWKLTRSITADGGSGWGGILDSAEMWLGIIGTLLGGGAAGVAAGGMDAGKSEGGGIRGSIYKIAPYALILGLFLGLSIFLDPIIDFANDKSGPGNQYLPAGELIVLLAMAVAALFQSWRIDINEFSLHNFYRNRLVRAYLGASDIHRRPHAFTGFDPKEDLIRLDDLVTSKPDQDDQRIKDACLPERYIGPYPIVNTALNLVAGKNLAWQQRMASSFVLTPKFYGFDVTGTNGAKPKRHLAAHGYRPTTEHEGGLSLGTAVATSGAAASPNMGYHSSKPLAFLMTMLNVRLGRWIGNPRHEASWSYSGPKLGLFRLLAELFGLTDDERRYVYLSDGGHFENLGIYELVKRRCRFIVACDGSQDGQSTFEDLGNAIEKCRTDLGIDIDIRIDQLRRSADGLSKWHCAVGRIRYDVMDSDIPEGTLLYLKTSLTGDEPTDVLRYAALNKDFPHQTTGDQCFDESQFESYRALGAHVVEEVIGAVFDRPAVEGMATETFITGLRQHWYPESTAGSGAFTAHAAALQEIWETLRTSDGLKFLDPQVYPEWQKLLEGKATFPKNVFWIPGTEAELRAGFYLCSRIIQLMESVYVDLRLEENHDHPDNRGWMNFFRHWSWAGMFRVTWAITASTYGARFQNFCKRRLDLDIGEIGVGKPTAFAAGVAEQVAELERLESALVLNFYEKTLIEQIVRMDGDGPERYLYPLEITVSIPELPDRISFPFGFAWVRNGALRFFRIQDHLRSMGLGRRALEAFIGGNPDCKPDLGDLPADAAFPNEKARAKFENFFGSVCAQLGLIECRTDRSGVHTLASLLPESPKETARSGDAPAAPESSGGPNPR